MSLRSLFFVALCSVLPAAQAADSDVDPNFGSTGWRRLFEAGGGTQDDKGVAFARTADGGYVVVAELPNGGANSGNGKRIGLFRLDRDGNTVTSFGSFGNVYKDAWLTSVTAMTIDAQGRIIVVGATPGQGGLSDFGVVRFNPDGSDDTSFAGDGGTAFGFDTSVSSDDAPTSVLAETDGKIVIAGNVQYTTTTSRFGVIRLNVDGSVDSTFGSIDDGHGGRAGSFGTFADGHAAYAGQIVHIDEGYYVITGTSVVSGTNTDFGARILTPDGSPWSGFTGSIEVPIDYPGAGGSFYDNLTATAVASPTRIVLAGTSSTRSAAVRLIASKVNSSNYNTLSVDTTFTTSQYSPLPNRFVGEFKDGYIQGAGVRSDGRIMLVGRYKASSVLQADSGAMPDGTLTGQFGLMIRLANNGSLDSSFGISGSRLLQAPTSGGDGSDYTDICGVTFDQYRMVLMGSSADASSGTNDLDTVITRTQSDTIFANGFESTP